MIQFINYKKIFYTSVMKIACITICLLNLYSVKAQKVENKSVINLVQKSTTVKLGDILSYTTQTHPSTGLTVNYTIQHPKTIKFFKEEYKYTNPQQEQNPVPGGDETEVKFYFKAIAKGKTKIIIKKMFRGETSETIIFTIEVK